MILCVAIPMAVKSTSHLGLTTSSYWNRWRGWSWLEMWILQTIQSLQLCST